MDRTLGAGQLANDLLPALCSCSYATLSLKSCKPNTQQTTCFSHSINERVHLQPLRLFCVPVAICQRAAAAGCVMSCNVCTSLQPEQASPLQTQGLKLQRIARMKLVTAAGMSTKLASLKQHVTHRTAAAPRFKPVKTQQLRCSFRDETNEQLDCGGNGQPQQLRSRWGREADGGRR
jgi:hypothetical protein